MNHVCIVSGDHLWLNPRVVKEADALTAAGIRVTVVGPTLNAFDQARDETILATRSWRRIAAPNLLAPENTGLKRFAARLSRRLQMAGVKYLGLPLAGALGYGIGETIAAARAVKADFYSCHLEVGLLAFRQLSRLGLPCAVDLEDWHSRDLPASAQRLRPTGLIAALERQALNEAVFTSTTSEVLADAFVAAYGGRPPLVVYNAFPAHAAAAAHGNPADRKSLKVPSLHWYSLNVGRGRGLELLFDAVDRLDQDFELHIRGEGPQAYKDELLARLRPETRGKVFFHLTTDPDDLPARIAEHDIGFALELRTPPSRDLTITNKVFQFLQGGCAVIASRTSGQEEAARLFPSAIVLTEPEPAALAEAIAGLLDTPGRLAAARAASREAGKGAASWEHLSKGLVQRVQDALMAAPGSRGEVVTMRRILVVAPHFPPVDTVDMHRVRMTVSHYRTFGWDPVILTARPEDTGRLIDPALVQTVSPDVPVKQVAAPDRWLHRLVGLNALGLRAGRAFERAGAELMEAEPFDLVFISTTSFPLMELGLQWKRRFGTPYVLDFQDPWATYPESGKAFFRKGPRHALMRAIHRRLERRTVPEAGGLMAVSQTYIDLLKAAYPAVRSKPALVSPFGYSRTDFEIADRSGEAVSGLAQAAAGGAVTCVFVGRVAPTMERALAGLFALAEAGRAAGHPVFSRLNFLFVGTGYSAGASERLASRLAAEAGISAHVIERPERISLLDAWKTTLEADILLVLGSDDTGYTPSKLNAALAIAKPMICAAPPGSPALREIEGMDTVVAVPVGADLNVAEIANRLERLLAGQGDYSARIARAESYEALECARRDCGLFDQVAEGAKT